MIVLDTTILVYAVGGPYPLRDPCLSLLAAARARRVVATTAVPGIQEFVHVRARRQSRDEATALAGDFTRVLAPLIPLGESIVERALALYRRSDRLDTFDAFLAAAAIDVDADALVSADRAYAGLRGLRRPVL